MGYSVLHTAHSALPSVVVLPEWAVLVSHPDVKLFMKGVFNVKMPTVRYLELGTQKQFTISEDLEFKQGL